MILDNKSYGYSMFQQCMTRHTDSTSQRQYQTSSTFYKKNNHRVQNMLVFVFSRPIIMQGSHTYCPTHTRPFRSRIQAQFNTRVNISPHKSSLPTK